MEINVASERAADRACTFIRTQVKAGRPMVVTVEPPERKRSLGQNARYWLLIGLVCAHVKVRGKTYSTATWHRYFKERYLTPEEVELPNGTTWLNYPSTSKLKVKAFAEYMEQVEAWAAERGVILPDEGTL